MQSKQFQTVLGILFFMTCSSHSIAAEESTIAVKTINPVDLFDPAPYGFSHVILVENVKGIAYIAGQGGEDKSGNLSDEFSVQVRQAYKNLLAAITAAGASPKQVTKITTYVVDYDQSKLDVMTKALIAAFGDHLPAQTLVPVPRLALDGMLFEVDGVVVF